MQQPSRSISSSQVGIHPKLASLVKRHQHSEWREPLAPHNQLAIAALDEWLEKGSGALIVDSFCGTGQSTAALAAMYPDRRVLGIDKSAHRLARHGEQSTDNYLLLQADCEPLWAWMNARQIQVEAHYLLYPNPWPKPSQLKRRIHGHPAFPLLLAMGGRVELRSNWQIYVEEFGLAMGLSGRLGVVKEYQPTEPLTLFERKYQDSGHTLWLFTASRPCDGNQKMV